MIGEQPWKQLARCELFGRIQLPLLITGVVLILASWTLLIFTESGMLPFWLSMVSLACTAVHWDLSRHIRRIIKQVEAVTKNFAPYICPNYKQRWLVDPEAVKMDMDLYCSSCGLNGERTLLVKENRDD